MLILDEPTLNTMRLHAMEGYPEEVCGLLIGLGGHGDRREGPGAPGSGIRRAREARRAPNLAPDPTKGYLLDPEGHRSIEMEARQNRREIVGVYHSHPDRPPLPSAADLEEARLIWESSESWSYVILEMARGRVASWKSWVLSEGSFREEPMEISGFSGGRREMATTELKWIRGEKRNP